MGFGSMCPARVPQPRDGKLRHLHIQSSPLSPLPPASMLIPGGDNDLARYLAWADKMYRRHVFSLFATAPPLSPSYVLDEYAAEREQRERRLGGTLPALLQRDALEDFLRFADQVYPVTMWQCLCWSTRSEAGTAGVVNYGAPDMVVPFVVSVEIGLFCQAERFREENEHFATETLTVRAIVSLLPFRTTWQSRSTILSSSKGTRFERSLGYFAGLQRVDTHFGTLLVGAESSARQGRLPPDPSGHAARVRRLRPIQPQQQQQREC